MSSKISQLPDVSPLGPSDIIPVLRGGVNSKARASAAIRVIEDADTPTLVTGDLFVKYNRTDAADLAFYAPAQDGLILTLMNNDEADFDATGTNLFYDGTNTLVSVLTIALDETVTFVSYNGSWVVNSRYSGPFVVPNPLTVGTLNVTNSLKVGAASQVFTKILSGGDNLDFGSILAAASADLSFTVTGALAGSPVFLALPPDPDSNLVFEAFVSAANTVTVRAHNVAAIAVDAATKFYGCVVFVLAS